jgi:two-component sensor histidine kinase
MLGLAAVAVGAHVALVEPLDQLARAVARWRHGGGFDPSGIDDPPTEIRELAATFGSATRALAEHEDRQRRAVEQQDLLMKEIHHRVKNNLQIVASLLNLQASRIRAPEAKAEFASARDRVRALATLHRHLYVEGEMHSINMRSFLTELCGQLFQAMGEREGKRITLNIEATELQMSSDQAVPLSLIVTEAVSNALKYAFPNGRKGHVDVRLTSDAEVAELVVCDNGIGIPAGKAETDMGPRDGIGITLIRGFARQLGGDLTVEEKDGTSYCLRMRLHRRYEPESAALEALPA